MPHTLKELAEFAAAHLLGDGTVQVTKVASIAQAQPGDLVFVQDEKDLPSALASRASAVMRLSRARGSAGGVRGRVADR
jgi:UDP-3-O-[3-hydroxymyristoyl] glucosamine N-acyltransferase